MSKTISYRGVLAIGLVEQLRLKTIKGKVGYKITKFQIISNQPGAGDYKLVGKVFKKDPTGSVSPLINFSNSDLLAAAYYTSGNVVNEQASTVIVFDNEMFNQDIFISIDDQGGNTTPCNYYIELEAVNLSELETTMLTLKSLRTITSR